MKDLTEQEARTELSKLSFSELVELAESQGKPTAGQSKEALVELLLGKCVGCKKNLTVVIISANTKKKVITNNKKGGAPCVGCGR